MNRRFGLQKAASQEHISLITIMFCFNEFAFTVQVKHKINSTQILGFILISVFTDRMPFLPPNQQSQSTEGHQHQNTKRKKLNLEQPTT